MAKPPSKRRGIKLGARADSAAALELLNAPQSDSVTASDDNSSLPDTGDGQASATPEMMKEQLAELHRLGADLDLYWQRQLDQMQEQARLLEQQRTEIAQQTRQLQALKQNHQRSRRLGVLLSLLAVTGLAAAGVHTWPRLQDLANDWNRVSTGVVQLAPQLEVVHGQVASLTSDMDQIGSDVTTLRKDVSEIRSDAGSPSRVAAAVPEGKPVAKTKAAIARTAVYTVPRNRSSRAHPYWTMHRMRPW